MESSDGKAEMVKPIIFKAGIPFTIAVGGFLLAKFVTRKSHVPTEVSDQEADSCNRDEENETDLSCELQQEISLLRNRIEDIQDRESRLETRFLCYQHLKDQEMSLMEVENKLLRELSRVELFRKEISLMGTELRMFENMVTEYSRVSRLLQASKSGNRMLRTKVEKLLRIGRHNARVLKKRNSQIEAKETEILRSKEVVDMKDDCIKKMEDEINELKLTTEQLKVESNKLLHDLDVAEKSTKPELEKETVAKKNYESAENYYEVMYLRRCNAFLRQELLRKKQELDEDQMHDDRNHLDTDHGKITEIEEFGLDNEVDRFAPDVQTRGRRRKLVEKLKKWVDGVEKTNPDLTEKEKHKNKCFRRRSASAGKEQSLPASSISAGKEQILPARTSCSSV